LFAIKGRLLGGSIHRDFFAVARGQGKRSGKKRVKINSKRNQPDGAHRAYFELGVKEACTFRGD